MEEEKTPLDLLFEIGRAYKNKLPHEEVMALYKALPDKSAISSDRGKTFIHLAAEYADYEAIEYLIAEGVKPGIKNAYGQTALHYLAIESMPRYATKEERLAASERTYKSAVVLLNARVSALMRDDGSAGGDLCYHAAMKAGNIAFIQALLDNKVKLDMLDKEGRNLLHLLILYPAKDARHSIRYASGKEEELRYNQELLEEHFQLAKLLIAYGIDPDAKDNTKRSPADYAVEYELGKLAILLKGEYDETDPSVEDKIASGGKSLHKAADDGDLAAVEALIRLGADLNEVNTEAYGPYENKTPLAVACYRLQESCVKALLDAGADPNFKGGERGRSAFYYMATEIRYRSHEQQKANTIGNILKLLLDAGLDPNGLVDDEGRTPINVLYAKIYRLGQYQEDISRELLDMGICNYNIADLNGVTPLMNIAINDFNLPENDLIMMLEAEADMSLRDAKGNTALMYAAMNRNHGNGMAVANLLFSFGNPMPELANNDGKTAMDLAVDNGNENLAKFLLGKM